MLYPQPLSPSCVCCLLILGPQRHLLVIRKTKKILLDEAGTFPTGMTGLGKLGVQLWGSLVLRTLWLLKCTEL